MRVAAAHIFGLPLGDLHIYAANLVHNRLEDLKVHHHIVVTADVIGVLNHVDRILRPLLKGGAVEPAVRAVGVVHPRIAQEGGQLNALVVLVDGDHHHRVGARFGLLPTGVHADEQDICHIAAVCKRGFVDILVLYGSVCIEVNVAKQIVNIHTRRSQRDHNHEEQGEQRHGELKAAALFLFTGRPPARGLRRLFVFIGIDVLGLAVCVPGHSGRALLDGGGH